MLEDKNSLDAPQLMHTAFPVITICTKSIQTAAKCNLRIYFNLKYFRIIKWAAGRLVETNGFRAKYCKRVK